MAINKRDPPKVPSDSLEQSILKQVAEQLLAEESRKAVRPINMLRPKPLAMKLGVSRSKLYQMIQDGEYPPLVKLGPRTSAGPESEADEWLLEKIRISRARK